MHDVSGGGSGKGRKADGVSGAGKKAIHYAPPRQYFPLGNNFVSVDCVVSTKCLVHNICAKNMYSNRIMYCIDVSITLHDVERC